MAQKHCRKFHSAEKGARTLQTDRRQTDGRTTDGRTTTYSEHEHEFTFAKNYIGPILFKYPANFLITSQ